MTALKSKRPVNDPLAEFKAYLRRCTNDQLQDVWEHEYKARRENRAELVRDEGYRRNIYIG